MEYNKAEIIAKYLQMDIDDLFITGSLRRKEPIVNDIDFITRFSLDSIHQILKDKYNIRTNRKGKEYMSVKLKTSMGDIKVDFWKAKNAYEYKFLKWMRSEDKGHNIFYRKEAKKKGLTLSDRGLYDNDKKIDFTSKQKLIDFITK